jgi:hypothetical protein
MDHLLQNYGIIATQMLVGFVRQHPKTVSEQHRSLPD